MAKINKRKNPAKGRLVSATVLLAFGVIMINGGINIASSVGTSAVIGSIIPGIAFIALGIYFIINARKITTIDNMITGGVTKVDDIAVSSRMSYDKVCKIINNLIAKGKYTDIYLDLANREIVHKSANAFEKSVQTVTCPNCHATTSDKNGVCEYCGASLR